jgi:hypothetical protein
LPGEDGAGVVAVRGKGRWQVRIERPPGHGSLR